MLPMIEKVTPNDDFTLSFVFQDRREGILDMKPYLNFGVFHRISEPSMFMQVKLSFDTVEWPCGADLDPEFIRSRCSIIESR